MAQKKMNQGEVRAVVSKIIREVNEINDTSNKVLKLTPKYIADTEAIKSKSIVYDLEKEIENLIKIKLGTGMRDDVSISLSSKRNSKLRENEEDVNKKIKEYDSKYLKSELDNWEGSKDFKKIYEEIIIAQIDMSDVNLLINSIKSKLI